MSERKAKGPQPIKIDIDDRLNQAVAEELRTIEGRLKTFVEAITDDEMQCKARKDMVSQLIWQTTQYLFDYIRQGRGN